MGTAPHALQCPPLHLSAFSFLLADLLTLPLQLLLVGLLVTALPHMPVLSLSFCFGV